jgi:hypothetical protein
LGGRAVDRSIGWVSVGRLARHMPTLDAILTAHPETPMPQLRSLPIAACVSILAVLSLPARSTPPIDQPGTLSFSCAGHANGNAYDGINQADGFTAGQFKCKEAFSPQLAKVKSSAAYTAGGGGTASGRGIAAGPVLRLSASNNASQGEAGSVIVGFTDTVRIDAPGRSGYGTLFYKIRVKGTLETHGPSGSASLTLWPLSNFLVTEKKWSISTDWTAPDASLNLQEVAVIATNFVFGQPLTITTVARAIAGIRSVDGTGHGLVDFSGPGAIKLLGIDRVEVDGAPITDYSFQSAAGLPW